MQRKRNQGPSFTMQLVQELKGYSYTGITIAELNAIMVRKAQNSCLEASPWHGVVNSPQKSIRSQALNRNKDERLDSSVKSYRSV